MAAALKSAKCACFLDLQGVGGHANDGGDTTGGHTAAALKSAKCTCLLVPRGVGGHANDGGDTTGGHTVAASKSAGGSLAGGSSWTFEAVVSCDDGTHTATTSKSAKCACFLILQGVGGHVNDGGDTTGGHTAAASKSAKCVCFLVFQGVGGHAKDGGDTTGGHTAAASKLRTL